MRCGDGGSLEKGERSLCEVGVYGTTHCTLLQTLTLSSTASTSGGLHQASWREQGKAPPISELINVRLLL